MVHTQFIILLVAVSVVYGVYVKHAEPYNPHPRYNYAYKVHDSYTGDVKSHHESRDGDVVKGSYSLVEPDGTKRTVHYTADDHHGFQAVVHTEKSRHRPTYVTPRLHKGYYKTPAKAEMSHPHASYNH